MAKHNVLVLGVGKIGSLITCLLSQSGDYHVHLGNLNLEAAESLVSQLGLKNVTISQIDAQNSGDLDNLFGQQQFDAVISSLPYYCNPLVADLAAKYQVNYFDLTEDVSVTEHVKQISQNQKTVFMPQCG
ncbi:MAG: saccharopine dehydrogenase NADP-binding domain-containing protein, partial [Gammaproteobacteria bacterium]|nr:saccharopine dehydrogenase NADP-binding domain-containing protein [Gammaproteobacteria bacterium]